MRYLDAEVSHLVGDFCRVLGRTLLQPVVDRQPDHPILVASGLEDGRGQQGKGVGATGAGNDEGRPGLQVGVNQARANGEAYGGDSGMRPHG